MHKDFFAQFGLSSEFSTPIGEMVKQATDPLNLGPDWSKNLQICDEIANSHPHREGIEHAYKAINRRLSSSFSEENTVFLALKLLDTCIQNCGPEFVQRVDRAMMSAVEVIAKGKKGDNNAEEALVLVQQWGRAFEKKIGIFPIFFDTFMSMKARGYHFPSEKESSEQQHHHHHHQHHQQGHHGSRTAAAATEESEPTRYVDEFSKLELDLLSVLDQAQLCREMLRHRDEGDTTTREEEDSNSNNNHSNSSSNSSNGENDALLADLVAFLSAVRDNRMDTLVQAGTAGTLGEELFELVLKVNDDVCNTLQLAEGSSSNGSFNGEAEAKDSGAAATGALLDMDFPFSSGSPKEQQQQYQIRELVPPAPAAAVEQPASVTQPAVGDFDAFLAEFTAPAAPAPAGAGATPDAAAAAAAPSTAAAAAAHSANGTNANTDVNANGNGMDNTDDFDFDSLFIDSKNPFDEGAI